MKRIKLILFKINWMRPWKGFRINFKECETVQSRSEDEVLAWREQNEVYVEGTANFKPILEFMEAGIPDYLMKTVHEQNFERPTVIQAQVSFLLYIYKLPGIPYFSSFPQLRQYHVLPFYVRLDWVFIKLIIIKLELIFYKIEGRENLRLL